MFLAKYDPAAGCYKYHRNGCLTTYQEDISSELFEISLFPNPANTECTITCNGILPPNASIAIYDLTGRVHCTYPLTGMACVSRVYTDLAVIDITPGALVVRTMVDGMTLDELEKITGVPLVAG